MSEVGESESRKRAASEKALDYVHSGMFLGLGSGSTVRHFIDLLGARVRKGLEVVGVPTSESTRAYAIKAGIPLTTLDELLCLDLTIDGADEIDRSLTLIKGGGGAHLREKIVALASDRMIIIAESYKFVERLGMFPLPLEVVPFAAQATVSEVKKRVQEMGMEGMCTCRKKESGAAFISDNGNYIFDYHLHVISDPSALACRLDGIPGLVAHGLFINMAHLAVLADPCGVRIFERLGTG
ncbi:MAG: ribose-5-phosphate isomerase RpiA [Alphaproteobacteria bacterium]|nr:ribose-5-phosphate isomerase RpiA [Alphaproteobacteria bacterium]